MRSKFPKLLSTKMVLIILEAQKKAQECQEENYHMIVMVVLLKVLAMKAFQVEVPQISPKQQAFTVDTLQNL